MAENNPYAPPTADLESAAPIDPNPRPAGFWIRVGAALIDMVVLLPVTALSYANLFQWKQLAVGTVLALVYPIYKVAMEATHGATVGKMAVRVRITDRAGGALGWRGAVLRYSIYVPSSVVALLNVVDQMTDPGFQQVASFGELARYGSSFQTASGLASLLMVVGCLMIVFNEKKLALHDAIARSRCVRRA